MDLLKKERASIAGRFKIIVSDSDGRELDRREVDNLVTTTGKAGVANLICNFGSIPAFTFIALGTGTTPPALGDTDMQTEITIDGLAAAAATISLETTDALDDTARLDHTFTSTGGSHDVTEAGVMNNVTAGLGVLLARQTFAPLTVVNTNTVRVIYNIDVD